MLPLVIGVRSDLHVQAVLDHASRPIAVLDVSSLAAGRYSLFGSRLDFGDESGVKLLWTPDTPVRGWVRRVAPEDWFVGVKGESREAAVQTSWIGLITELLRAVRVEWLSHIDAIVPAENKLRLVEIAQRVGVSTPKTVVSNSVEAIRSTLGHEEVIAKPLGPGHFIDRTQAFGVFSRAVRLAEIPPGALKAAPFIFQEKLEAERHFRVVTVGDEVWSAVLEADGLPVDWRSDKLAHHRFRSVVTPAEIALGALRMTDEFGIGYSSQDWIETRDGFFLVDVNPSGQWLFLPNEIGTQVAAAIARWLVGEFN